MAYDLVIDLDNTPGSLAKVAAAISDAGVNIAAATCLGPGQRAELHILVKHPEAARHSLAISHDVTVTREREVVVVEVEDQPGVLARVAGLLSEGDVSVATVVQTTEGEGTARLVIGTHRASEGALSTTVERLAASDVVDRVIAVLRVEGE